MSIILFRSWEFPFDTFVIYLLFHCLELGNKKKTLKRLWYKKKAYYISIRYMKQLVNK